jgi:hypothetical protein
VSVVEFNKYYMNILFLPIDIEIPKIDTSKIQSTINVINNLTYIKTAEYQQYWDTSKITETVDDTLKSVLDQLPINKVTNVYYKEQRQAVSPHIDVYANMKFEEGEYANILDNEPVGYRLVLEGSTDVLYVKSGDTFKLAKLPKVPCLYIINSTAGLHMVKDDPGRKIIYIRGFIDKARHQTLIEKSLKRYKNLAIIA